MLKNELLKALYRAVVYDQEAECNTELDLEVDGEHIKAYSCVSGRLITDITLYIDNKKGD